MATLEQKQVIHATVKEAWDFFSDPRNLNKITPPSMGFKILNEDLPEKIHAGMIIRYTVKPLLGIPMTWVTEILDVKEPEYFTDSQLSGPYSRWHHKHIFKPVDGGVEITDVVEYKVPLGFLGKIAEHLFVKRKVESIFAYRESILHKYFKESPD
jgi:ligand-binding SRPBCC domain-containing protein